MIDNPDVNSERALITSYCPSMDPGVLDALASAFGELRRMTEQGVLSYPYSTRELVAVAKVRHDLDSWRDLPRAAASRS